jgi:hypothetical protein
MREALPPLRFNDLFGAAMRIDLSGHLHFLSILCRGRRERTLEVQFLRL